MGLERSPGRTVSANRAGLALNRNRVPRAIPERKILLDFESRFLRGLRKSVMLFFLNVRDHVLRPFLSM
jgi:hypothetical protein